MAKTRSLRTELRAAQRKYGEFESMDLLVPDLNGFLRGKRVRPGEFDKVCKGGFVFCAGATLLTGLGEVTSGVIGADDGDPDLPARLIPGSIVPVPWASRPMGQAFFRIVNEDGGDFFGDPRTVLENALKPLKKRGLTAVVATELEFYLLDGKAAEPKIGAPLVPGTDRPQPGTQVYNPDDLFEVEGFLDDVYAWCEAQNVPAEAAISEYSAGQFEINLHHVADAVLACDHAVMLKRIIKAAARKHGFIACFMAKPFEEDAGSGLHIHMSIVDKNGNNYFSQGKEKMALPPFSARLRHAVGGLLKIMPESTLLGAPNANSYRRYSANSHAPTAATWGQDNRFAALRIPRSSESARRLEHRMPGSDTNPYLAIAAILAAALDGLENATDPGPTTAGLASGKGRFPNPARGWREAIDAFAENEWVGKAFGADLQRVFVACKRQEFDRLLVQIPPAELEAYLEAP